MSDNKVRYFHPDYPSIRMIAEVDYYQLKAEFTKLKAENEELRECVKAMIKHKTMTSDNPSFNALYDAAERLLKSLEGK